ncbi:hypothetical protein METBIDRAFT_202322 [Metschnikowia bicuspidata var. bicuspidata NRRL YB-4993]|uniref:Uncharacterized protein n=1 Tax=Metschnikowia bicuspidata var. bicuspidata NRRL YB-4993 TaxID=869754 RepID=A0A1A0H942_9ASCO|nr:hypothetical protein METBIDRAFT_202322 [Metschnikowia bicuspidata var. bicuspidata NRRL YB-4993]OBA20644.1 hypothetical protein METBIDRAFT_202322 [Metschnikowia bicuspidata var. bicuspidata NRRL YB-4993]
MVATFTSFVTILWIRRIKREPRRKVGSGRSSLTEQKRQSHIRAVVVVSMFGSLHRSFISVVALLCWPFYVVPFMLSLLCCPFYVVPFMLSLLCCPFYCGPDLGPIHCGPDKNKKIKSPKGGVSLNIKES